MGVRLPAEYQEVEYLEGLGAQYIATNIVLKNEKDIYIISDFLICDNASGNHCIMGIQAGSSDGMKFPNWCSGSIEIRGYGISNNRAAILAVNNRARMIFDYKDGSQIVSLNNEVLINSSNSWTSGREEPLYIFATSMVGGSATWLAKARIYGITVRLQNEEYIFTPCYRKSDDEPGMYDIVSKTFYTNQGTGDFLVGPDVVNHISPRLMDRRRALIAKLTSLFRKVITSQTGLVSFDTNVAKPMKVTCEFSPKQDLHGYDAPWPAGGGANKWDEEWELGGINNQTGENTTSSTFIRTKNYIPVIPGETYYCCPSNKLFYFRKYGSNKEYLGYDQVVDSRREFTVPNDVYYLRIVWEQTTYNNDIALNYPATVTTYAPYENICPIEGRDGANIQDINTNWLDEDYMFDINSYSIAGAYTYYYTPVKQLKPNTTYSLKIVWNNNSFTCRYFNLCVFTTDEAQPAVSANTMIPIIGPSLKQKNFGQTFTTGPTGKICFGMIDKSAENLAEVRAAIDSIQINLGSTACEYQERHVSTLPITFNQSGDHEFLPIQEGTGDPSPENIRPITPGLTFTRDDNTTLEVWGGSLTVNADGTGTITSKFYQCVYDGVNKKANSSYLGTYVAAGDVYCSPNGSVAGSAIIYCDKLKPVRSSVTEYYLYQIRWPDAGRLYFVFPVCLTEGSGVTNAAECIAYVNNWFQNNPTSVAYKLLEADYQTYTLSVAETSRAFEALGLGKNLGPLYGGSVTINEDGSADVVATWAKWIEDGSRKPIYAPWASSDFENVNWVLFGPIPTGWLQRNNATGNDVKSNNRAYNYINSRTDTPNLFSVYNAAGYASFAYSVPKTVTNADETATYFQLNPSEVVYKLATPQTYHFSSISELQSFLGTNNIWSDLNGSITVEYYKKQQ